MAQLAIAGLFVLAIACGVGFGAASADSADELARAGAFGFDEATHVSTQAAAASAEAPTQADTGSSGQQVLATASARNIDAGLAMVDQREAEEKVRIEADNKAVFKRVETKKAMQGVGGSDDSGDSDDAGNSGDSGDSGKAESSAPAASKEEIDEYNLPAVDWSVGKVAFVEEWSARIDAYLDGTPLAGYGTTFAEAAWENGVDPRWSPAISNTESGNGDHCFLPYNAWGWGEDAWPDWDTAIRAHVAGLADSYGYSVTFAAAQQYCPPNSVHWYNNTLAQMSLI